MTSPGLQKITKHKLVDISRIKGNETMEFSQLIDYSKRNIFHQKSCRKKKKLYIR